MRIAQNEKKLKLVLPATSEQIKKKQQWRLLALKCWLTILASNSSRFGIMSVVIGYCTFFGFDYVTQCDTQFKATFN